MNVLNSIGVLLGATWASGVNLYMTVAGLGIAQRMHWIDLPGEMKVLGHPLIILTAIILYAVEFVADKIPIVDSIWDSIQTFIRPAAGAVLGFMAFSSAGPVVQVPVALLSGSVAMDSHLTKATTRVAVNSTMAGANPIASITEDVAVAGVLYLIIKHPVITAIFVMVFIVFSIWFLAMMFKFMKKVFLFLFWRKGVEPQPLKSV
ncbi:MAG: DUF4126 domain-containing protein [Candidatus Omnitrophica bacterium]|nr:DUF4126 domain-containing protein [Candidatus Omnitrophota bacterium]